MRRNRSGQGVLEYVIVLTVIIAAIIAIAVGALRTSVQGSLTKAGTSITTAVNRLP
jgi:Flp pilus assembly pilin Flp